jgi:hypothetical protein
MNFAMARVPASCTVLPGRHYPGRVSSGQVGMLLGPARWCLGRPRRQPGDIFTAWTWAGAKAGCMLGVIVGVVVTGLAVISENSGYDESYVITFAAYLVVAAVVFATFTGLLVGMLNGAVLALMTRAGAFRSAAGIRANRVTVVAVLTTALSGLGLMYQVNSSWFLIGPPVVAGVILAAPLSRWLPPVQSGG